jgi:hypothetical protein
LSRIKVIQNFIGHTADKLEKGLPLTDEERDYWVTRLRLIANGCPADMALDLKARKGEKKSLESKRKKISLVLHLIASYHQPWIDPRVPADKQPKPLSLTGAIYKVLEEVPEIMGDGDNYDYEQIRSWWYDRDKLHMQSPIRSVNDPDNPY